MRPGNGQEPGAHHMATLAKAAVEGRDKAVRPVGLGAAKASGHGAEQTGSSRGGPRKAVRTERPIDRLIVDLRTAQLPVPGIAAPQTA